MLKIIRNFFRPKAEINPDFVRWMGIQCPYTPDIAVLEESQFQLLFACDDLMFAGKNYELIRESSAKVERGFTRHKFNFFSDGKGGGIPIIGRKSSRLSCRNIKGEIHAVESSAFPRLDSKYKNGVYYRRIRVPIIVPYRDYREVNNGHKDITGKDLPLLLRGHKFMVSEEKVCVIRAWMYVGLSVHWNNHLDGGYNHPEIPYHVSDRHPGIASYYQFPKWLQK